jgi:AraC-like DNA-binding protein
MPPPNFVTIQPSPVLRDFVSHYYFWEELHSKDRVHHSIVPEHLTSLAFFTYVEAEKPNTLHQVRAFNLQPYHFDALEDLTLRALTVGFFPWGAIKLLSQDETRESISNIEFDAGFQKLSVALEHLLKTGQLSEAVEMLDGWLIRRLGLVAPDITPAIAAARDIIETKGQTKIETLAETVGLSRRQLERGFGQDIGFTPKLLSRLIRFEAATQELQKSETPDLAQIAFELGFYDQSHLTKEFHVFGQITPLAFSRQRLGPEELL